MWTTIALYASGLVLVGGICFALYRIGIKRGMDGVHREIAEGEAERRAKDAEIAARPAGKRPLDSLFR